jgi:hypothetical protein
LKSVDKIKVWSKPDKNIRDFTRRLNDVYGKNPGINHRVRKVLEKYERDSQDTHYV